MTWLIALSGCTWISEADHLRGLSRWDFTIESVQADWDPCATTEAVVIAEFGPEMPAERVTLRVSTATDVIEADATVRGGGDISWTVEVPALGSGDQLLDLTVIGKDFQLERSFTVEVPAAPIVNEDLDGDGFGGAAIESCEPPANTADNDDDCDDNDANVRPGATEICDGIDNDCNDAIDDDDPHIQGQVRYTVDDDNDGQGSADSLDWVDRCAPGPGEVTNFDDCDDTDAAINTLADEICDHLDNDCDGSVDDGDTDVVGQQTFYADQDNDGYGDDGPTNGTDRCFPAHGEVDNNGDCDDEDPNIHPGMPEICDGGVDNDCANGADSDDPGLTDGIMTFADVDEDQAGDPDTGAQTCGIPAGRVLDDGDCDDLDSGRSPLLVEVCDGLDNDCDPNSPEPDGLWVNDHSYDTFATAFADISSSSTIEVCGRVPWPPVPGPATALTLVAAPGTPATVVGPIILGGPMMVTGLRVTPLVGNTTNGGAFQTTGFNVTLEDVDIDCGDPLNFPALGGGIYADHANVTLYGTRIHNCNAELGGALYATGSTVRFVGNDDVPSVPTVFDNNTAAENGPGTGLGGGLYLIDSTILATVEDGFELRNNTASAGGGAWVQNPVTPPRGWIVEDNTADTAGGMGFRNAPLLGEALTGEFRRNMSTGNGGALFVENSVLDVADSVFEDNTALRDGGAIWSSGTGSLTVSNGEFLNNDATGGGGAIYAQHVGSSVFVSSSTFVHNEADEDGGAIFVEMDTSLSLQTSTFTSNVAFNYGGAVYLEDARGALTSSVFTGNTTTLGDGGAITAQFRGDVLDLDGLAFVSNTAFDTGGALALFPAANNTIAVNFVNQPSTFTNNSAGSGGAVYALAGDVDFETDVTFTNNHATHGSGGGWFQSETGALLSCGTLTSALTTRLVFTSNLASSGGGAGLYLNGCTANLWDVSASANEASANGSAIRLLQSNLTVFGSLEIFGNRGTESVYLDSASLIADNWWVGQDEAGLEHANTHPGVGSPDGPVGWSEPNMFTDFGCTHAASQLLCGQ